MLNYLMASGLIEEEPYRKTIEYIEGTARRARRLAQPPSFRYITPYAASSV